MVFFSMDCIFRECNDTQDACAPPTSLDIQKTVEVSGSTRGDLPEWPVGVSFEMKASSSVAGEVSAVFIWGIPSIHTFVIRLKQLFIPSRRPDSVYSNPVASIRSSEAKIAWPRITWPSDCGKHSAVNLAKLVLRSPSVEVPHLKRYRVGLFFDKPSPNCGVYRNRS